MLNCQNGYGVQSSYKSKKGFPYENSDGIIESIKSSITKVFNSKIEMKRIVMINLF